MKTPSLWWSGAVLVLLALFVSLPLKAQNSRQDEPRKNYITLHIGFAPNDYHAYGKLYRRFGPVFSATYGRRFNNFISAEGTLFVFRASMDKIRYEEKPGYYFDRTCRYGINGGILITPLGQWFRFVKFGIMAGFSREDLRECTADKASWHTDSFNCLDLSIPLRLYALDGNRCAVYAETNFQNTYDGSYFSLRTVHYGIGFSYKF